MLTLPLQFQIVHFNSYIAVAVYTHYFTPGSLRIKTKARTYSWAEFDNIFGERTVPFNNSRRWLVASESPYPGYCRAPGTGVCVNTLCNCVVLQQLWGDAQKTFKMTHLKGNKTAVDLKPTKVKGKKLKSRIRNMKTTGNKNDLMH